MVRATIVTTKLAAGLPTKKLVVGPVVFVIGETVALNNLLEDETPQLGGMLDVNGFAIGNGSLELLAFAETASAVNEITVTNAATGGSPSITASGDDAAVDLVLDAKGTGAVKTLSSDLDVTGNIVVSGLVDGQDIAGMAAILLDTITADSVETLTNKTFDANGVGNAISNIDVADHSATGTPDATTFYRGDNTWAVPADTSTDVTLAGAYNYLTLAGQEVTLAQIDLTTDVTGVLPVANYATGTPDGSKFLRDDATWQPIGGGGDMLAANNLSDLTVAATARTNLGVAIGSNVQAWAAVLDATTASFTTADETKLDFLTVTQAVDLDTIETDVAANTAKVTNANHTGDATGSTALTIAANAVTYAKMQDVSATDRLLGRSTAGAGVVEEIVCTAAGRALLDDASATAQIATLGLDADLATFAVPASTTISAFGATLVDDADAAAALVTLGIVKEVTIYVVDYDTALPAIGDGKAYFRVPKECEGLDLTAVGCGVGSTPSSGGTAISVGLRRLRPATPTAGSRTAVEMLSVNATIDNTEWDSTDATAATINTDNDDVEEGDIVAVDLDQIGTGAKGLFVTLGFS